MSIINLDSDDDESFLGDDWEMDWDKIDKFITTVPIKEEIVQADLQFQEDWESILEDFEFEEEVENTTIEVQSKVQPLIEMQPQLQPQVQIQPSIINSKRRKVERKYRGKYKTYHMKQPRLKGVWKRGPYKKTRSEIETVL